MSKRLFRGLVAGTWAATALVAVGIVVFRAAAVALPPALLVGIALFAALLAAATLALAVVRRSAAAILLHAGLLVVLGGGLANAGFSLQGFVVLTELEAIPLTGGRHLQVFERGPLSEPDEMDLTLQLESLELVPSRGGFLPMSQLRLIEEGSSPTTLAVQPGKSATLRTLRFHQGAFGFAPRIVITRNGEALFDRHVPFTTRGRGGNALSFEGAFNVQAEDLAVSGAVDLESLDENLRGHPRLGLRVQRDGKPFGAGELEVGHFAKLPDGYAIGFAGLKKWSEIDISRRNYPQPILGGAILMLAGCCMWPFSRRRP